jgi:hypothetical protein
MIRHRLRMATLKDIYLTDRRFAAGLHGCDLRPTGADVQLMRTATNLKAINHLLTEKITPAATRMMKSRRKAYGCFGRGMKNFTTVLTMLALSS